jgi:DNA modification methylase
VRPTLSNSPSTPSQDRSLPVQDAIRTSDSQFGEKESASELEVIYQKIESLTPFGGNARTHSRSQIRKLRDSIQTFGFVNPILTDSTGTIVAGHGRVQAAKLLGMTEVPTICLENLTSDQIRAYVIADNRLAEDAGWDEQILKIELQHLISIPDIDVSITGFEVPEIDLIIGSSTADEDPDDQLPELSHEVISKLGDAWCLGSHRIYCGDARNGSSFAALMEDRRASVVFVDPPYNVSINGHASGNGRIHHADFAMASGEMNEAEFIHFLKSSLEHLAAWSTNGSIHFVAMDWRHMPELLAAGRHAYDSLLNLCVWNKNNGGMGSLYRSQHELIFVYKAGAGHHRNNVQLGRFGRNRTNVWNYPGANTLTRTGEEGNLLALHPTVKPVALVTDALLDCSARGEIVLDSFLGAGSTLLAAERIGRICYGMEIEPRYVDLAILRWQQMTGEHAHHAQTGVLFDHAQNEEVAGGRD